VFPQPLIYGGTPKIILVSRGTSIYENVQRSQKADSGESISIAAKLFSREFICKELIYIYIYIYIYNATAR
jgi:hypothetical protein